jgi:hypothetical protein
MASDDGPDSLCSESNWKENGTVGGAESKFSTFGCDHEDAENDADGCCLHCPGCISRLIGSRLIPTRSMV